jgi:hypothetical protein
MSFSKLSNRDEFGYPLKFRSVSMAKLGGVYGNDEYVKALLHFDADLTNSAKGGSGISFTNSSTLIDSSSKFGDGCLYIPNTSSQYISSSATALRPLDNDFTMDFWMKRKASSGYKCLIGWGQDPKMFGLYTHPGGELDMVSKGGSNDNFDKKITVTSTSSFSHFIFQRSGDTYTLWKDGAKVATATSAGTAPHFDEPFHIGDSDSCWIDEFRLSIGIARTEDTKDPLYSTNGITYTPPTEAYP